MKYVNYILILLVSIYASAWVFNHVNAWVGILMAVAIGYFVVFKLVKLIKENLENEKN